MRKKQRLVFALAIMACVALAAVLAGYALRQQVSLFFTPSEVEKLVAVSDPRVTGARDFRLGGVVLEGSVRARADDLSVRFDVTDRVATRAVSYKGMLPDLFREGQGVIATGRIDADGVFVAHTLLAKHDENYMPPEVAKGLERVQARDLETLKTQQDEQGAAP